MASPETRSRDEWLAEVKRRGERIRRRRRLAVTLVGVLALVLPGSALAGFLSADHDQAQELSVAGPAPARPAAPDTVVEGPGAVVAAEEPATTTTTSTTPPQRTVEPTQTRTAPATSAVDDPVVRPATTTTVPAGNLSSSSSAAPPSTTIPPPPEPLAPCAHTEVIMTLKLEKDAYRPGEIVRGSAAVEPRPGVRCRIFGFSEFQILNSAGKDVMPTSPGLETSSNLSTGDDGTPAYSRSSFAWEAIDCTPQRLSPVILAPGDRTGCVPFPPGRYTVVALWEDGWMPDPTVFQLTA